MIIIITSLDYRYSYRYRYRYRYRYHYYYHFARSSLLLLLRSTIIIVIINTSLENKLLNYIPVYQILTILYFYIRFILLRDIKRNIIR